MSFIWSIVKFILVVFIGFFLLTTIFVFVAQQVEAGECEHPRFYERGCPIPSETIVVPVVNTADTTRIVGEAVDQLRDEAEDTLAAALALPSVTPEPGRSRMDVGTGFVNGSMGVGLTFSHRGTGDSAPVASFSYGNADGKQVGRATLGWQW
jgi:hypothetical protein